MIRHKHNWQYAATRIIDKRKKRFLFVCECGAYKYVKPIKKEEK